MALSITLQVEIDDHNLGLDDYADMHGTTTTLETLQAIANEDGIWEFLIGSGLVDAGTPAKITAVTPVENEEQAVMTLRDAIQSAELFGLVRTEDGKVITGVIVSPHGLVLTEN